MPRFPTIEVRHYRRFHLILTAMWAALVLPTVLWWHDSVLWVGLISCYANAVGHFSAWQATRAEQSSEAQ